MGTPEPAIYEFDDFRVDAVERVLLRNGASVPLTPRVFDTLLCFVRHYGRVLEKDELMRRIWPDAVVEENNLNQNVSTLRRVLGTNQYIVTIPGRGYRFAATVRSRTGRGEIPIVDPGKTIAVLPFVNMSADPENEYFCDGLAEELINALTKIEGLRVVARTSAFSFKGKNANINEIRDALGVGRIVEGSVRRSGIDLRITVQLINAETGYHLWSDRYDRRMEDIFEVQDAIAMAVVNALKVKLLGGEQAALLKHHTGNPEAHQLYLKGRYYWYKASVEDFRKSREYYERAIQLDSTYALAHSGLADYYGFATATGMMSPNDCWPKVEAAAMKALEIDETLAEVHNPLAALKVFYYRDWTGAEREFKRAIELNPQFGEIHHLFSVYLAAMGRFDESIRECRRSLELDPLSCRINLNLGWILYFARRFDEAVRQYREALELDPNNALVHEYLGDAFEQTGKSDEAITEWRTAMTLAGDEQLGLLLGSTYAETGFSEAVRAVARKRLERSNERAEKGEYVASIDYARAYLRLGDKEEALRRLVKACEERNRFPLLLNIDPFYDSLRADPRFRDLVRRIGLPEQ